MDFRKFWIKMNILYEKFMLLCFVLALLIVLYALYDSWYIYHKANDKSYLDYKPSPGGDVADDAPITDEMVAWITIDDTSIDYPVMQGENNTKFLNVDPYGEYSLSGSIFLDSRNASDFSDKYSILYGHHMEYGTMFGALDEYLDDSYLRAHSEGTLLVGRKNVQSYRIRAFASAEVDAYSDDEFFEVDPKGIDEMIKTKAMVYDQSIEPSGKILALSTCVEAASDSRLIVFFYIID